MKKNLVNKKRKIKLLFFDFDGTLFDTKKAWYDSIVKILKEEEIFKPKIEATLIIHFGKKISDILSQLEIDKKKIEKIKKKIYREMIKKIKRGEIKPIKDFDEIKKIKCKKIIISNSTKKVINKLLHNKKYFDFVFGAEDFENKEKEMKKIMKKYKIDKKYVGYVGDRAGDIKLSKKIGCISIAIYNKNSWNSLKEILKEKPDYLINNIGDLLKIFEFS